MRTFRNGMLIIYTRLPREIKYLSAIFGYSYLRYISDSNYIFTMSQLQGF